MTNTATDHRDSSLPTLLHELLDADPTHPLVLLRETALDASCVDHGDVDLLGSRAAVDALVQHAMGLVREGRSHVRIRRRSADKVELELLSLDLQHRIVLDLWLEVWQIDGGERCLCFEDVFPEPVHENEALLRMPPDLEASVYIHHLATKRKDLGSDEVRARIEYYTAACSNSDDPQFAVAIGDLLGRPAIPASLLDLTRARIRKETAGRPWQRRAPWGLRRIATQLTPRGAPLVAIVGCDGSGKTSLAEAIARGSAGRCTTRVGKDLYRDRLPFRLLYRIGERILGILRERIDEAIAPLAFGLAWVSLWFVQLRRYARGDQRVVLMDRALVDFLYLKRKSDQPRFSSIARLLAPFATNIPTVHLIVPHEILDARKGEITVEGHATYDSDMLDHYSGAAAFDYLALTNRGPLDSAAPALSEYLLREHTSKLEPDQAPQS